MWRNIVNIVFHIFLHFNQYIYLKMILTDYEGLSIHFSWLSQNQTRFSILIQSVRPSIFVFPAALWADWLHFFARHRLQFYGHWRWLQIIQKTFYLIWDLYGLICWLSKESFIYKYFIFVLVLQWYCRFNVSKLSITP